MRHEIEFIVQGEKSSGFVKGNHRIRFVHSHQYDSFMHLNCVINEAIDEMKSLDNTCLEVKDVDSKKIIIAFYQSKILHFGDSDDLFDIIKDNRIHFGEKLNFEQIKSNIVETLEKLK